ncbi:MAG: SDR family oxidoreductase [Proteobacteria bacterium]|nr:SDR family oxidoreductase [Pseudomonadota bacterium]
MSGTAIVAGASGVVGRRLVELLTGRGWRVIGLNRSGRDGAVAVDLESAGDCHATLTPVAAGVTHLFYAAQAPGGDVGRNAAMLRNLLDAVEPAAPGLAHVHLVHGTRYYGSHLGAFATPAREDDPRHPGTNFYFDQQDLVTARRRGAAWSWSISRPHTFCDVLPALRSLPRLIAVYAAVLRELDEPLFFPGSAVNFEALYQCTDVSHLARAIVWMATEPSCANQVFNVTNGDGFRWAVLWPRLADALGMAAGPVRTLRLADFMADKDPVWQRLLARHDLATGALADVALWPYADYVFMPGWDILSDTTKIRRFGFAETVDTAAMFARCFERFRADRLIP